jgi:hypothetical protein
LNIPRGSDRSRAVKGCLATLDDAAFGAANGYDLVDVKFG